MTKIYELQFELIEYSLYLPDLAPTFFYFLGSKFDLDDKDFHQTKTFDID